MKNPFKHLFQRQHLHGANCHPTQTAEPLFKTGHEHESITEHQGEITYDSKDGFGNALPDEGNSTSGATLTEKKIPPAF